MEGVAQQTGQTPDLLRDEPEIPVHMEHIWRWFLNLSQRRGGGFGPGPLTWNDMAAFFQLTGQHPDPWEIDLITRIDNLWLDIVNKDNKEKT